MKGLGRTLLPVALMLGCFAVAVGQNPLYSAEPGLPPLNSSGKVAVDGKLTPYVIRHLPISSFPQLPLPVQEELTRRGCLIPQTYEAHQPENVVNGSFERPGSSDWGVLCSAHGTVSLLVFFASRADQDPFVLGTAPETERLQSSPGSNTLGFNWGIDAATPDRVHDAQAGIDPRPPLIGHDALADSTVDHRTIYHFYAKGTWTLLDLPEM